jgi:hypothetical protein
MSSHDEGKLIVAVCLTTDLICPLSTTLLDYTYSVTVNLCHRHVIDADSVCDIWIELVQAFVQRWALILALITQMIRTIRFLFQLCPALQQTGLLCWQSKSLVPKMFCLRATRLLWGGWLALGIRIATSGILFFLMAQQWAKASYKRFLDHTETHHTL